MITIYPNAVRLFLATMFGFIYGVSLTTSLACVLLDLYLKKPFLNDLCLFLFVLVAFIVTGLHNLINQNIPNPK